MAKMGEEMHLKFLNELILKYNKNKIPEPAEEFIKEKHRNNGDMASYLTRLKSSHVNNAVVDVCEFAKWFDAHLNYTDNEEAYWSTMGAVVSTLFEIPGAREKFKSYCKDISHNEWQPRAARIVGRYC